MRCKPHGWLLNILSFLFQQGEEPTKRWGQRLDDTAVISILLFSSICAFHICCTVRHRSVIAIVLYSLLLRSAQFCCILDALRYCGLLNKTTSSAQYGAQISFLHIFVTPGVYNAQHPVTGAQTHTFPATPHSSHPFTRSHSFLFMVIYWTVWALSYHRNASKRQTNRRHVTGADYGNHLLILLSRRASTAC